MQKIILYLLVLVTVGNSVSGQTWVSSTDNMFEKEQQRFIRNLKAVSADSFIVYPLARYFESEVNTIHSSIISDAALSFEQKEKAVRSLVYFMSALGNNIAQQKTDMYDIPGALRSYKSVLAALIYQKPVAQAMVAVEPRRSQLLATTFSQYKEHVLLDDITVYKRIAASPEFIIQFLESKPEFRFADSLLYQAVVYNPTKFISYLNKNDGPVQQKIRNSKNTYLRQIVLLSYDKSASELMPFVIQLAEGKMAAEEVTETRKDVVKYFQLLVNTLKESRTSADSSSVFLKLLRNGVRQKALAFYVNQVNELHNAKDPVRFASVKNLRPEDLYYIITSCGEELYTSSYLGLYKRLMEQFKDQSADALFDLVQYDNFHTFLRLAANYNVADHFLRNMSPDRMGQVLHRFIGGIENDPNSGLDRAMDIADFFAGIDSTEINGLVERELQSNLSSSISGHRYLGVKLYSTLLEVFEAAKENGEINKLWATLGNYEVLKRNALENKAGEIVQLVLFYGDDDGKSSFGNFLKLYGDKKKWELSKNENWVSIRSLAGEPIVIYANLPLDSEEELDLRAQDSLLEHLQAQSIQPSVLIHRGHSYHLDKTLKRLNPSVRLAILGSCGSYNKSISLASVNPDIQVIGSKKTGSKSINDPIIDVINETLLEQRDLSWPEIWSKLSTRFSKDEGTLSLFNEYFSPDSNLSLFVLKLYSL
jgi:hypothetical protein